MLIADAETSCCPSSASRAAAQNGKLPEVCIVVLACSHVSFAASAWQTLLVANCRREIESREAHCVAEFHLLGLLT